SEDVLLRVRFSLPNPEDLRGVAAIQDRRRRNASTVPRMYERIEIHNLVVHKTMDPEVVVVEWDYHSTVGANDEVVINPNIIVLRVRDGLIVESRDYHNYVQRAIANGTLDILVDDLGT